MATKSKPRVLVGQLFQEGHGFTTWRTGPSDFTIERGHELLNTQMHSGSILGGIVQTLTRAGAQVVPSVAARARPGGPVWHSFYEDLKAEIVDIARRKQVDAVALDLHGAMLTDQLLDPEGDLLAGLRDAIGPGPVIGVGLDLHASLTRQMLEAATICTACKKNPHSDLVETGQRLATQTLAVLAGQLRPASAFVRLPMILCNSETADWPLSELHNRARDWLARNSSIVDVSICSVTPFVDMPECGQVIHAITDGRPHLAATVVADLAERMWRLRRDFTNPLLSIDEALDRVLRAPDARPYVLGDQGDRVLAGTPGDSTVILNRILERKLDIRAAIPITDPEAVRAASLAGVGSNVRILVGGKFSPQFEPVVVSGTVASLNNGRFVMQGPYMSGQASSLGDTAVVETGNVTLLLTSIAGFTQDPAAFTSQGIDLASQDVIVVKSGSHFKLSFSGVGTPLVVESPGLSTTEPGSFVHRLSGPVFPQDDVETVEIKPTLVGCPTPAHPLVS